MHSERYRESSKEGPKGKKRENECKKESKRDKERPRQKRWKEKETTAAKTQIFSNKQYDYQYVYKISDIPESRATDNLNFFKEI